MKFLTILFAIAGIIVAATRAQELENETGLAELEHHDAEQVEV